MTMLDRTGIFESVIGVILCLLVCVSASRLLAMNLFDDFYILWFAVVVASAQFSLVKSVQPESTSPTHGYNRLVSFSRAFYFLLFSWFLFIMDYIRSSQGSGSGSSIVFYGFTFESGYVLDAGVNVLIMIILLFPIIFTIGLLPQVSTFAMFICEHCEILIFGGNATTSLLFSMFTMFRSIFVVLFLWYHAYVGIMVSEMCNVCIEDAFPLDNKNDHNDETPHVIFSIYLAILVAFSYHLSRCAGNPTVLFEIIKSKIISASTGETLVQNSNQPRAPQATQPPQPQPQVPKEPQQPQAPQTPQEPHTPQSPPQQPQPPQTPQPPQPPQPQSPPQTPQAQTIDIEATPLTDDSEESIDVNVSIKDTLPQTLRNVVIERMNSDVITCVLTSILVFAIGVSTVFTSPILKDFIFPTLVIFACSLGFVVNYLIPELRKEIPWITFSHPILIAHEHDKFEVSDNPAKIMKYEHVYIWLKFIEKNILLPAVFLCSLTTSARTMVINQKWSIPVTSLIITVCGMKMFRNTFNHNYQQYLVVAFTYITFKFDFQLYSETFAIDYMLISIVIYKVNGLLLRLQFFLCYIVPWQFPWGSAFHAFTQPLCVPHSAIVFIQIIMASIFSAPMIPLSGSAIFFMSYFRPIKFWERDYKTKRLDNTNARLATLEGGANLGNVNAIFYEHLTRSLQKSLCGDILMGRWGNVQSSDCFIMASDYLNALIHIIEVGNGLVTFQLRGLEFRGTYCQEREVEAITEDINSDTGVCGCDSGHFKNMLSLNTAFHQRWLAWQVVATKYVIQAYNIAEAGAGGLFVYSELRHLYVKNLIKTIIYFAIKHKNLSTWMNSEAIKVNIARLKSSEHTDLYNCESKDSDYDTDKSGVTLKKFTSEFFEMIQYCHKERFRDKSDISETDDLVPFCWSLSLIARRQVRPRVDQMLACIHSIFKGDFRLLSEEDEWVFSDILILSDVIAKSVKIALKLHQDHFTSFEEYDSIKTLVEHIKLYNDTVVICHEDDVQWRNAILSNHDSLLSFRHIERSEDIDYSIVMLNKRYFSSRIIKLNSECVRGLWAGQQHELIFLRNRNPERGSIQNAKQVLRNMINSSCDQPIGYPIYVSPLMTSYSSQDVSAYTKVIGSEFKFSTFSTLVRNIWKRIKYRCNESCTPSGGHCMDRTSSRGPNISHAPSVNSDPTHPYRHSYRRQNSNIQNESLQISSTSSRSRNKRLSDISSTYRNLPTGSRNIPTPTDIPLSNYGQIKETSPNMFPSTGQIKATAGQTSENTITTVTGALSSQSQRVKINDSKAVFNNINLGRRIDVQWPNEQWRLAGGTNGWSSWAPQKGMQGFIVHKWIPHHPDSVQRSNVERTILLVKINDRYVPISDQGVTFIDNSQTNITLL